MTTSTLLPALLRTTASAWAPQTQILLLQQQQQHLGAAASAAFPPLLATLQQQQHPFRRWWASSARDEERVSYFHQQKQRAMQQQQQQLQAQEQQQQPGSTALVTLKPNETRASIEQVVQVVRHPALIITRPIEWGTVIFGYEQANRYTVYDQDGQPVAQLMEDYSGLGNELGRQLLRTHRSFTATVFSADGSQVIFRLRRPAYLINSTMLIEDGEGKVIGEVRQKWHPIRRNYDLYLGKQQFAAISGTFLAWEFELKDEKGGTLALIDRNFQGFGKELFTDAGKYAIHFGMEATAATAEEQQRRLEGQGGAHATPLPGSSARGSSAQQQPQQQQQQGSAAASAPGLIPTITGNQLVVQRPLALDERMITLAAAISIDYDFFSQHSNSGGWLRPPIIFPMPGGGTPAPTEAAPGDMPPPVGAPGAAGGIAGSASAGAAGETVSGGAFGGAGSSGSSAATGGPSSSGAVNSSEESFLGGDEFQPPPQAPGDGEMRWDLPSDSGAAGDTGEAAGGASSVLGTLWSIFTGGDE